MPTRFERAGFWLQIGGTLMALGGIVTTLAVVNLAAKQSAREPWFVIGIVALALGVLALAWSLFLYLRPGARRSPFRIVGQTKLRLSIRTVLFADYSAASGQRTRFLVHVRVENSAEPTVLYDWRLSVKWAENVCEAEHIMYDPPPGDFPTIAKLRELAGTEPFGVGTTEGRVSFILLGYAAKELQEVVEAQREMVVRIVATDQTGRSWSAERDLRTLYDEGYVPADPKLKLIDKDALAAEGRQLADEILRFAAERRQYDPIFDGTQEDNLRYSQQTRAMWTQRFVGPIGSFEHRAKAAGVPVLWQFPGEYTTLAGPTPMENVARLITSASEDLRR